MFYGDGRTTESPSDFIKLIQASFDNKQGITEEQKCERLFLHCKSDSDAEEWYEGLSAPTNTDWGKLITAFRTRWPKRARVKKTPEQKKAELFADKLEEDRLMEKEERGGVPVYAYIAWADRVEQMASSLGDTQGFLVSVVRDSLPKALRSAIGTSHLDWGTFTAAVRDVSPTTLRTAIDDKSCLRSLENAIQRTAMPQSPTAPLRQAFSRAHITAPPASPTPQRVTQRFATPAATPQPDLFAAGGTARTRLFAYQANRSPSPSPAAPSTPSFRQALPESAYRDPKVRLLDLQRNSLPQQPDTEAGHVRYRQQIDEWQRKHGTYPNVSPDEFKPYPLTPGTKAVSTGACFNCGGKFGDHIRPNCPVNRMAGSVPAPERTFRVVAAVCHGLIRGPVAPTSQTPPTPVRSVDIGATAVDITNADDAYIQSLIDAGATITEVDEQGKEVGSSE